jgi:NAD(P)-dependent dehydrogenase (short-subunit alcohol dehydrogenase family)
MKILISGASSGIGRYLTGRLSAVGHEIWGFARSKEPHANLAGVADGEFRYTACNVSEWREVESFKSEVRREWSSLDALICCGGIQAPIGLTMEIDPGEWSANIRTNLDGTFFVIRAFFEMLRERVGQNAKVLCFSGGGASSPRPNFSAYACAKAGVVRLVENLSVEWNGIPVDINAIAPGAVPTAMTAEVLQIGSALAGAKEFEAAEKLTAAGLAPMTRAGDLVEFLLSPASDGISGRLISAPWDPWQDFASHREALADSDIYTLRRITPQDRNQSW